MQLESGPTLAVGSQPTALTLDWPEFFQDPEVLDWLASSPTAPATWFRPGVDPELNVCDFFTYYTKGQSPDFSESGGMPPKWWKLLDEFIFKHFGTREVYLLVQISNL